MEFYRGSRHPCGTSKTNLRRRESVEESYVHQPIRSAHLKGGNDVEESVFEERERCEIDTD